MPDPHVLLSTIDDTVAKEKGRLLAAMAGANNPEQRKRAEEMLGVEFCKKRWPEMYSASPFFRSIIDKIKHMRL